jgi:hypothetical protein
MRDPCGDAEVDVARNSPACVAFCLPVETIDGVRRSSFPRVDFNAYCPADDSLSDLTTFVSHRS